MTTGGEAPAAPEFTRPGSEGPPAPDLASVLHRNIDALRARREREEAEATVEQRIAQKITDFAGSMAFVYLHLALVVGWVLVNTRLVPLIPAFDRSFVILATVASVEAIFLSTFVLISQNRISGSSERRADLDLQINLLAEHEVTRLMSLVSAIAEKMGVEESRDPELGELRRDVAPEAVLDEIHNPKRPK